MPTRSNTRAAQGSGTIRQRKDGRWEARYTVGRDPGTGKQIQRSIYGATQEEVRKKLTAVSSSIDNGTYIEPSKLTMKQWLEIWLKEYTANIKESTAVVYDTQIRVHILPAIGAVKLSALNAPTIQAFYNSLSRGSDDKEPLAAKTVKNVHGVLNRALFQAVRIGYIRFNPCNSVLLPRLDKPDIKPLSDLDIKAFVAAIKGHPLETVFVVDLFTGMRQSELMGLTWDCVDFKAGTILINKQLIKEKKKDGAYKLTPPKNDKPRRISPAPYIMDLLKGYKRTQAENRIKAGSLWVESDFVFTNHFGHHLAHSTLSHTYKRFMRQIGLPESRFHDMRHSFAVSSLQAGDDVKTVQENLGHHTAAFTLDVYGHVTERMKQESAARMQGFIKTVINL